MKTVKDKYLVVGADFAGYPLKEAVVAHLKAKGWKITDLGVTAESDPDDTENMFHRVGIRVVKCPPKFRQKNIKFANELCTVQGSFLLVLEKFSHCYNRRIFCLH